MSKLNDLTSLIARLTKSEKRHITIGIHKLDEKEDTIRQMHQLFQALNSTAFLSELTTKNQEWESSDESTKPSKRREKWIKRWLAEQNDKKLTQAVNVNRLFLLIFDQLRQFHSDKPEFRIDRYLQDIRIYRSKRLYSEALKLIRKAKQEILYDFGDHLKAQELLFLEKTIRLETENELEEFAKLNEQVEEQAHHIQVLCKVLYDREKIVYYQRNNQQDQFSVQELSAYTQRVITDIEAAEGHDYSFEIRLHALVNAALYYEHLSELSNEDPWTATNQAFPYRKKLYEMFRDNPIKQVYRPDRFKQIRHIYLSGCLHFSQWEEAAELIAEEEESLGFKWKDNALIQSNKLSSEIEFRALYFIVAYYMYRENYERLAAIMQSTENPLSVSKTRINIRYALYVTFTFVSLLLADRERVANYLAQIKKMHHISDRKDYILVEVLDIIHAFESRAGKERSVETDIGNLIVHLGQQQNTTENQIARDILSSLYLILAKESKQSAAQDILLVYQQLAASMDWDRIKGTIFANFPFWIKKKIADLATD